MMEAERKWDMLMLERGQDLAMKIPLEYLAGNKGATAIRARLGISGIFPRGSSNEALLAQQNLCRGIKKLIANSPYEGFIIKEACRIILNYEKMNNSDLEPEPEE